MKDDYPVGPAGAKLDDLPPPKARGLFRKQARMSGSTQGQARLRLVSSSGVSQITQETANRDPWDDLRAQSLGKNSAIAHRAATGGADDPVLMSFDLLRTALLKILRTEGWARLAVAAPTRGCGATFTAAHLALSLARIPEHRTVLMDLNMRRPGLAGALDLKGRGNTRGFLRRSVPAAEHLVRVSATLALGLTQVDDPEASHLLHSTGAALAIADLMDRFCPETLICDMPPLLEHDDLAAFLPQVDGVLLVADAMQTTPEHIALCERRLEGQTRVLGVVLNQALRSGPQPLLA